MNIAVLSGKGGTGKTLLTVNLAAVAQSYVYIDCDVEEPNGHLFFKPIEVENEDIAIKVPTVDDRLCNGCRICVNLCKFNALAYIAGKLIIFQDICHSCGGCLLLCPEYALTERDKYIGMVSRGTSENVIVHTGVLNIGEPSGTPIIKKLIAESALIKDKLVFIDCPPGSACVVMESIKDVDYCILVAEPTRFGVHNLSMVWELVKLFNKPHGVILNKCLDSENPSEHFCLENNITILGKIPFDHEMGTLNSNGLVVSRVNEKYHGLFSSLLHQMIKEVGHETTLDT